MSEHKGEQEMYYPQEFKIGRKMVPIHTCYSATLPGMTKVISIAVLFCTIVLIYACHPIGDERGPAIFSCFVGIIGSFAILLCYTFLFQHKLPRLLYYTTESVFYGIMACLLFVSALLLIVFNARYWSHNNPDWAVMPALAAASLLVGAILYVFELYVLFSNYRKDSWEPEENFIITPKRSVLPN
ncbi:unnamed protein product [Caenorhabditis angaria]|uniref:MARVEL domain-containing protein n=1 Tax=Caenorhabditis angaria TaxID=860376 RepID=A0A9P1I5A1_9PELO|nr:unnamed protein product [Caenorhabditis angaria]